MAKKQFQVDLDLNLNQLLRACLENVETTPEASDSAAGQMVYRVDEQKVYQFNGEKWHAISTEDAAAVSMVRTPASGNDTAVVYTLSQGGREIGKINIPADMVVKSGSLVNGTWAGDVFTESTSGKDKALKLVIANSTDVVYINVKELVNVYTGSEGDQIIVAVAGSTISAKLSDAIAAKIQKIDTLNNAFMVASAALTGKNGRVLLDNFAADKSVIMQATKNGEEIIISMTYNNTDKVISWESNTAFTAADNVIITAMQVQ